VYTNVTSFVTHKPASFVSNTLIPIQTFYEKDGYLLNLEGRVRKFYKAVTPPKGVLSLETFFITLLRAQVTPTK
jgi:NADH dehydrogenase/NADH:ubiquinone oxidoreductase subunit G